MSDTAPESPEQITARTGSFGCISVQFPTDDRGRVTFMWHVTREVAEQWIAEFTERMCPPHQEAMASAELVDAWHAFNFKQPQSGLVWVDHAKAADDG